MGTAAALTVLASVDDWQAHGHAAESDWLHTLGVVASFGLLALYLALVVKALLRQGRYRAVDVLGVADLDALHAGLREVEARTSGEIVPVVLERSDRHPAAPWLAGLWSGLLGSVVLAGVLPWDRPGLLLLCQVGLGLVGWLTARLLPDFQRQLITEARADEMAAEQALQEFHALGLRETRDRTGVLLFVSLLERRVIVLGDEGIDAVVGPERWQAVDDAILAGIRAGDLARGLADGIAAVGEVLVEHFPVKADGENEIPDRVVVRVE